MPEAIKILFNPCGKCAQAIDKNPNKNSDDCASCAWRIEYVRANGHDIPERKRCPKCGKYEPEATFGKNKTRPDGLSSHCLECKRKADWERRMKSKKIILMKDKPEEKEATIPLPKPEENVFYKPTLKFATGDVMRFGGFTITDLEAMKIKAVLLKLHDFLIGPEPLKRDFDLDTELLKIGPPEGVFYLKMIKKYREMTGSNLKEANEYCHALKGRQKQ